MRFIKPVKGGGGVDTSDATALAKHILRPYTAYAAEGKITGTMIDKSSSVYVQDGSITIRRGNGNSIKVTCTPFKGYYENTLIEAETVIANILPSLSNPAKSSNIQKGYDAIDYHGSIIEGTAIIPEFNSMTIVETKNMPYNNTTSFDTVLGNDNIYLITGYYFTSDNQQQGCLFGIVFNGKLIRSNYRTDITVSLNDGIISVNVPSDLGSYYFELTIVE